MLNLLRDFLVTWLPAPTTWNGLPLVTKLSLPLTLSNVVWNLVTWSINDAVHLAMPALQPCNTQVVPPPPVFCGTATKIVNPHAECHHRWNIEFTLVWITLLTRVYDWCATLQAHGKNSACHTSYQCSLPESLLTGWIDRKHQTKLSGANRSSRSYLYRKIVLSQMRNNFTNVCKCKTVKWQSACQLIGDWARWLLLDFLTFLNRVDIQA